MSPEIISYEIIPPNLPLLVSTFKTSKVSLQAPFFSDVRPFLFLNVRTYIRMNEQTDGYLQQNWWPPIKSEPDGSKFEYQCPFKNIQTNFQVRIMIASDGIMGLAEGSWMTPFLHHFQFKNFFTQSKTQEMKNQKQPRLPLAESSVCQPFDRRWTVDSTPYLTLPPVQWTSWTTHSFTQSSCSLGPSPNKPLRTAGTACPSKTKD